jgi:hypothetical protein
LAKPDKPRFPSPQRDRQVIEKFLKLKLFFPGFKSSVVRVRGSIGTLFGGATAFPRGEGIWRDDAQGGKLLFDNPVVIQCYTSEHLIEQRLPALRDFLHRMGREARQGAIGLVIDDDYLEIGFPLEEAPTPQQPKGKKRR